MVHLRSKLFVGSRSGKNGTKWKRLRIAASISAIERSAVFIVPMNHRFFGKLKLRSDLCITAMDLSRYSRQKQQFAEHPWEVRSIDLVNHHDVLFLVQRRMFSQLC